MTSISSSGGGFVTRIKRATAALKGKDGSRTSLFVDGNGRLHTNDSQLVEIKALLEEIRDRLPPTED